MNLGNDFDNLSNSFINDFRNHNSLISVTSELLERAGKIKTAFDNVVTGKGFNEQNDLLYKCKMLSLDTNKITRFSELNNIKDILDCVLMMKTIKDNIDDNSINCLPDDKGVEPGSPPDDFIFGPANVRHLDPPAKAAGKKK